MFTARRYDAETANYYYRARYYKLAIGRFLQPDPIGYEAGLNLYRYCGNNPINFVDPWGLDIWVEEHKLFHKNINVGNPKGSYDSWSYRVKGNSIWQALNNMVNPFAEDYHTGIVYEDIQPQGEITRYLKTTQEQDRLAKEQLHTLVGEGVGYDLWGNNCRGFSDTIFDLFSGLFSNKKNKVSK